MLDKLRSLNDKYEMLQIQLSDPEVTADMKRYLKLNKEYKNLEPFVFAYKKYDEMLQRIDECK